MKRKKKSTAVIQIVIVTLGVSLSLLIEVLIIPHITNKIQAALTSTILLFGIFGSLKIKDYWN